MFTVGSLHGLCFFLHPSFPSSVTYFVLKLCGPVFQQVNQEQPPTPGRLEAADVLHRAQKLQCTWQPAGKAQHKEEKTRLKLTEGSPWEVSVGTISTVLVLADKENKSTYNLMQVFCADKKKTKHGKRMISDFTGFVCLQILYPIPFL